MNVLILGGNRYVGRRAAALLLKAGEKVTVLHRSPPTMSGVRTIRGDRTDPAVLSRALATQPDAILDMSLYTPAAARLIVESLSERRIRYVGVSTAAIYSQEAFPPWDESTPVDPAPGWGSYGVGKANSDATILEASLPDALLVRPVYVIGHGDPDRRCDRLFSRALSGLPIDVPGSGESVVQVLDADDMADILIQLLTAKATGVMDIPGAIVSVLEFTERCVALTGRSCELRLIDSGSKRYLPEQWPFPDLNLWVGGQRFLGECSVRPRSLTEILSAAFEDYEARHDPGTGHAG